MATLIGCRIKRIGDIGLGMMKRVLLLLLLNCNALCAAEPIVLERISAERINTYTLEYQKELKRLGVKRTLFYGAGAVIVTGVLGYVLWQWMHPRADKPVHVEKNAQESLQDGGSVWRWTKNTFKWAWTSAFYAFAFSEIVSAKNVIMENFWPKSVSFFGSLSAEGKVQKHERLVGVKGKSMATMVAEYERLVARAIELGGKEPITLSFVAFLEQQIIHQNEAFVRSLEDVLACLYAFNKNKSDFEQELNARVVEFSSIIDASSCELEGMLNAPLDGDKLIKCKKGVAVCKEVALYAERFATDCCSLILKRDV